MFSVRTRIITYNLEMWYIYMPACVSQFIVFHSLTVVVQISRGPHVKQTLTSVLYSQTHAKIEQHAQTFLEAISAVVLVLGKDLIVPSTRMTVLLKQMGVPHV